MCCGMVEVFLFFNLDVGNQIAQRGISVRKKQDLGVKMVMDCLFDGLGTGIDRVSSHQRGDYAKSAATQSPQPHR